MRVASWFGVVPVGTSAICRAVGASPLSRNCLFLGGGGDSMLLSTRMAAPLLTIYFVRHGETTGNRIALTSCTVLYAYIRDGILQGHQDYDLMTLGEDQAAVTAARLRDVNFWQTHSSDLVRASRTAEIILSEGRDDGPGCLVKSPLLREFALGVLEDLPRGITRSEARRIKAERAGVPLQDFEEPRAETATDVRRRAQKFLHTLLTKAREARSINRSRREAGGDACSLYPLSQTKEEMIALLVSHGGFLYEMLSNVLGLGDKVGRPSNCSVTIVDVYDGPGGGQKGVGADSRVSFVPRVINDFSHMEEAGLATANRVENLDVSEN